MLTDVPKPARFGLIACSSVARRRFVPALLSTERATLERVGSRDPGKARTFAAEFGCAKFGSYEDLLNDPDVDCVYVSTPPSEHKKWTIEAAKHGKHILCEKPAAMNLRVAQDILACSRENNVCFLEGYTFRFHPQHAEVKNCIRKGMIGEPRLLTAQFTYPRPPEGDFRFKPELGGGVFFDSAGYPVASALMFFDSYPVEVFATFENDEQLGIDVAVSTVLRFSSGQIAQLYAGMALHYRSRYAVLGTRGRIEVERAFAVSPSFRPVVCLEDDNGMIRKELEPANQFRLMIERFADAVYDEKIRDHFASQFLRQHAVMEAAFLSAKQGKPKLVEKYSS